MIFMVHVLNLIQMATALLLCCRVALAVYNTLKLMRFFEQKDIRYNKVP